MTSSKIRWRWRPILKHTNVNVWQVQQSDEVDHQILKHTDVNVWQVAACRWTKVGQRSLPSLKTHHIYYQLTIKTCKIPHTSYQQIYVFNNVRELCPCPCKTSCRSGNWILHGHYKLHQSKLWMDDFCYVQQVWLAQHPHHILYTKSNIYLRITHKHVKKYLHAHIDLLRVTFIKIHLWSN